MQIRFSFLVNSLMPLICYIINREGREGKLKWGNDLIKF